ncbi:hypothetical protein BJ944DRAFT_289229 [Cunninghamella echinulata]|nr:hypothetical protein BJ944DRAFT_289229 [Cunninghamella echinulata]
MSDTGICSSNNYSPTVQQLDISLTGTISWDASVPKLSAPIKKKPEIYEYMVHCTMTDLLQLKDYRLTIVEESNTKTEFRMIPLYTDDFDDDGLINEKMDKTNKEVMASLRSFDEPSRVKRKIKRKELVTLDPDSELFVPHLSSPPTSPPKNNHYLENFNQLTLSMKKLTNGPLPSATFKSKGSRLETINTNVAPFLPSPLDKDKGTIRELKNKDNNNNNIHKSKYIKTALPSASILNKDGNNKKITLDPTIPEFIPPKYLANSLATITTESKIKMNNDKKLNPDVPSFIPMMHQHKNENNENGNEYEYDSNDNEYEYEYEYDNNEHEHEYEYEYEYEHEYEHEYAYEHVYEYEHENNENENENENTIKLDPKATIFIPPTSIRIETSNKHLVIAPPTNSSRITSLASNNSTITSSTTPTSPKSASTIKPSLNVHSTPFVPQQRLETTTATSSPSSSLSSSSKTNPPKTVFNIHSTPFVPHHTEENSTNQTQLTNSVFHAQPLPLALRSAPTSLSPSALLASSFYPDS